MKIWLRWSAMLLLLIGFASPCPAEEGKFKIIYRQDSVVKDETKTASNVMVNVLNNSGMEAKDLFVSVASPNRYLPLDFPIFVGTIGAGHQAEVLQSSVLPNDVIAISEPDEKIVWRIEYLNDKGEPVQIELHGERGI